MKHSLKQQIGSLILVGCCTCISTPLLAEEASTVEFSAVQVAPGLYSLMGKGGFTGGNIGLSIGSDGVVLIDDSMPPLLDKLKMAISQVTEKPVDFLINTHVHADHTGNNSSLAESGAWIVAHENLRSHLLDNGIRSKEGMIPAPAASLPVITFADSITFHLNDNEAHIFHVANAHTNGDAVIHFKQANVIHTGDVLFNGMFPYIDLKSGGSLDGFIKAQKKIWSLCNDDTKLISGHGDIASKKDLETSIAMLEESKKLIADLLDDGKTEEQVVELNPLSKFHDKWNWRFITTERMTRQVFQSLNNHHEDEAEAHEH